MRITDARVDAILLTIAKGKTRWQLVDMLVEYIADLRKRARPQDNQS